MKRLLLSGLLALLFLAISSMSVCAVEIGISPPDIQLEDLDGQAFRLSDHKGELIILKLATTWCPTCQQQTAEFRELSAFLKEKNIRIVEVFLQDSEKMVREYVAREKFESPLNVMIDDGQALRAYNVYLIPRIVLIDRDFNVMRDGNILTAQQIRAEFEKVPVSPVAVENY